MNYLRFLINFFWNFFLNFFPRIFFRIFQKYFFRSFFPSSCFWNLFFQELFLKIILLDLSPVFAGFFSWIFYEHFWWTIFWRFFFEKSPVNSNVLLTTKLGHECTVTKSCTKITREGVFIELVWCTVCLLLYDLQWFSYRHVRFLLTSKLMKMAKNDVVCEFIWSVFKK